MENGTDQTDHNYTENDLKRALHEFTRRSFVSRELITKAELFEERHKLYGDNYKRFGDVMVALFPGGVQLRNQHDFARFGVLVQVISKMTRYCENFSRGGHDDSLDDQSVYCMMLKEVDQVARQYDETFDV